MDVKGVYSLPRNDSAPCSQLLAEACRLKQILPTVSCSNISVQFVCYFESTKSTENKVTGLLLTLTCAPRFSPVVATLYGLSELNFELFTNIKRTLSLLDVAPCVVPTSGPSDSLCQVYCCVFLHSCSLINISWRGNPNPAGTTEAFVTLASFPSPPSEFVGLNTEVIPHRFCSKSSTKMRTPAEPAKRCLGLS